MDKLEKFIRANRSRFDSEEPDEKVWERLQNSLQTDSPAGKKPRRKWLSVSRKKWLAIAASLLLCISFAAFVRTYQVKKQQLETNLPEDLVEAQAYYQTRIHSRIEQIKSLRIQQNFKDTALWQLFGHEGQEYERLRSALKQNPGDPHVRAAFVEYYRSRLEVLQKMEEHLETSSQKKNP